jgi:hypothetical protein
MLDPITAYTMYSAAWNEPDPDARKDLIHRAWSDEGVLFDPETPEGLVGGDALIEYIAGTHEEMPDLIVAETAPPEVLGNRLRVRWEARQAELQVYTGTDFVEFAEDGRVSRVTMFYDSTPRE